MSVIMLARASANSTWRKWGFAAGSPVMSLLLRDRRRAQDPQGFLQQVAAAHLAHGDEELAKETS